MGEDEQPRRRRATTAERREQQIIAAAYNLAEEQIHSGTASAMVLSHFLKAGSQRDRLERTRLEHENLLTQAKIEDLKSRARSEEMFADALEAMKKYGGHAPDEEYDSPQLQRVDPDTKFRRSLQIP